MKMFWWVIIFTEDRHVLIWFTHADLELHLFCGKCGFCNRHGWRADMFETFWMW